MKFIFTKRIIIYKMKHYKKWAIFIQSKKRSFLQNENRTSYIMRKKNINDPKNRNINYSLIVKRRKANSDKKQNGFIVWRREMTQSLLCFYNIPISICFSVWKLITLMTSGNKRECSKDFLIIRTVGRRADWRWSTLHPHPFVWPLSPFWLSLFLSLFILFSSLSSFFFLPLSFFRASSPPFVIRGMRMWRCTEGMRMMMMKQEEKEEREAVP